MKLDTIYFDQIREGKKIYEVRIFDQKRRKIKLLDEVTLYRMQLGMYLGFISDQEVNFSII